MAINQDKLIEIFSEALAKASPEERTRYLAQACGQDAALRLQVDSLLQAHIEAGGFLRTSVVPPESQPLAEGPGTTIDRYKLLQQIGEGGFGLVFMAEQREPVRRMVALKIIKAGMDTREVIARFEAERQALALMDHPNIARVLDGGTTVSGRPYFVMDLVKGIPITDFCDQNHLSTEARLRLLMKVCAGLQHAHQKGIIHRDLKPTNVLVTVQEGEPVPKVIDFGIAKAIGQKLTERTLFTRFEQMIGTPAYMSPEQAEWSGVDIDTRSDIYSLGALLYELLTGTTPFEKETLARAALDEMRRMIREAELPKPSTRLQGLGQRLNEVARQRHTEPPLLARLVHGDLDWIVMKALEKDRARRYETVNALARDVERHLNREPVTACPPSTAYRVSKFIRRHRFAVAAATAVTVALVTGLVLALIGFAEARRASQRAKLDAARADAEARNASESQQQSQRLLYASDMNLAQQALRANNLGRARRLLDRHRPQPGEEDLRGWEWRYLWQLTRSTALVTLTNRPTRGFSVSFSPDGSRLAVGWLDGRVDLWDVSGRRWIRTLTDGQDLPPGHAAFSPIRNLLAATSETNTVSLYDLESGRESILWRAPGQGEWVIQNLAFSQDGSRVVIYAGSDAQDPGDAVWVVNVSSAKTESRHPTAWSSQIFFGGAQLSPDNQRLYLARSDSLNSCYSIRCLDLATGQELWQTEPGRDLGVTALAISPDGRILASASGYEDPSIRVWDAATGRLLVRLEGHTGWVCRLAFSRDARRLISAATDQTIRIWDTVTWTEAKVLRGHRDEVWAVAISETRHLIASASKDGDLMLWNDEAEKANDGYLRLPGILPRADALLLDRSRVVFLPHDKPPELFDLRRGASLGPLPGLGPSSNIWSFDPNWLCRWNGTNQILVEQWSGSQFAPRGAVTTPDSGTCPGSVAFNPGRQLVAWNELAESNSVFLTTLSTSGRAIELKSEIAGLRPALFSGDGRYLAAVVPAWAGGHAWKVLHVWNVDTGQRAVTLGELVTDMAFAVRGRVLVALVVVSQNDHEIRFYDLDHPDRAPRRVPGKHAPQLLAVSPDDRVVAATTDGGAVRLCDAVTGELIEDLRGNPGAVFGVAFSKHGRRLISACGGREAVKLWDVGTRQELLNLSGTGSTLYHAAWSADGDTILAGTPWQAWHAPSWEEIAAVEAKDKAAAQHLSREPGLK